MPSAVRSLLSPDTPAVLRWHTVDGPVALPAHWHSGAITVPSGALELAGALSAGPACLTVQRWRQRISSVRGLLIRGNDRARVGGDATIVSIDPELVSWWSGEDTGTVRPAVEGARTACSADPLERSLRGV